MTDASNTTTSTAPARPRRWPGRLARLALWLAVLAAALLLVMGIARMVLATAPEHLIPNRIQ